MNYRCQKKLNIHLKDLVFQYFLFLHKVKIFFKNFYLSFSIKIKGQKEKILVNNIIILEQINKSISTENLNSIKNQVNINNKQINQRSFYFEDYLETNKKSKISKKYNNFHNL